MLSDQHKSESRRAAFGFYPVLNLASSRVVISRLKATVVTTFTPYCLFLFFHCTTGLILTETLTVHEFILFAYFIHLLAATLEARLAVQAVHQQGFIFSFFCLTTAKTPNVRARETCMKRFCVSLHMSRSQPVIVVLSFFCLFDIL